MASQKPDNRELLHALKIERETFVDDGASEKTGRKHWVILLGLSTLIFVAAYTYQLSIVEPDTPPEPVSLEASPISLVQAKHFVKLNATGYVTARRIATVSSRITGRVEELLIEEGDFVKQGDLLARLNSDLALAEMNLVESRLISEMANLHELDADLRNSRLKFERVQSLHKKNLTSQSSLDQAMIEMEIRLARLARHRKQIDVVKNQVRLQGERLRDMEIRAPFDGVIIAKTAQAGEMISPVSAGGGYTRTGIGTLVDMTSLEVEVEVNESNINLVKTGQLVEVVLNSYPDLVIPSKVITIVPTANRNKATIKVRIAFLVQDLRVIPDMGVKVSFLELKDEPEKQTAVLTNF